MFAIVQNARESQFSMVGRGASREAWQWLVAKSVSSRMWYVFPRSGGQSESAEWEVVAGEGTRRKGREVKAKEKAKE